MAFDLKSIQRGVALKAPRIFIYGVEGVGKSTLAASSPNPVFLQTEDGLGSLDVARFPMIETVDGMREALTTLYTEDHDFQTVVLDSADWLHAIIERDVEGHHDSKETAFGRGAVMAAEIWHEILMGLNALRNDKGMTIILLGHSQIKRYDDPNSDPYDRYLPKMQERSSSIIREWVDALLFANYQIVTKKAEVGFNKEVVRGVSTGKRLLFTNERPAFMGKNRYSMPDQIDMSWDAIVSAINPQPLKAAA